MKYWVLHEVVGTGIQTVSYILHVASNIYQCLVLDAACSLKNLTSQLGGVPRRLLFLKVVTDMMQRCYKLIRLIYL